MDGWGAAGSHPAWRSWDDQKQGHLLAGSSGGGLGTGWGPNARIPYAYDEETRNVSEWADFPVELLYDQAGDCEDHGIFAAAVLHVLGHDVGLFYLRLEDCGHLALACQTNEANGPFVKVDALGRPYFYIETVSTNPGHLLGDMPPSFVAELKEMRLILVKRT